MESLQSLNRRRKAVTNIGAITKAMEVVAAIKMRKSQETALDSRPYAFKVLDLLEKLSRPNIYTKASTIRKTVVVLVTSDRGLIGSFNTQVLRVLENFLSTDEKRGDAEHQYSYVAVGKKAERYLMKKGLPLVQKFYGFGDLIELHEINTLSEFLTKGYEAGNWSRVVTISMHFRSAMKQETLVREILPLDSKKIKKMVRKIVPEYGRFANASGGRQAAGEDREVEYIFEPSPKELLENLMPHLMKMELYHLVLEANASEHAARYVAMKSASDNAKELSEKLMIQYNKVRQAAITREIIEITYGRA